MLTGETTIMAEKRFFFEKARLRHFAFFAIVVSL